MEQERLLQEKFNEMMSYENNGGKGYQYIAGVDEVGRGPLAGPVLQRLLFLPRIFS